MQSEVDTSILNSVNIKRFTQSVLEEYDAEVDQSNSAKWEVNFPEELAQKLDRQRGTLVFDAADRELGADDLLVQPGTTAFSALLELVQQPGSIGHLRLTEDTLQVNPPTVLQESSVTVASTDFTERTSDVAYAFHFQVQFETPSSFHSEEMFTVTVDPTTQARIPELTDRLTAHLPQLLQENNQTSPHEVSENEIQAAFKEAQQAVVDRSRPIVTHLREEADESATERIEEISSWYDQRRKELDQQLQEQRQEIRKWKRKRRKARKDSTRRKYIRNRKEAEEELARLQDEIQAKKQELDAEESEEIDDVIDRNEIDVDVSLLGITEVTYVRGTLALELRSPHTTASVELSYLPATDEFRGLDCEACSRDLTDGVLPQLCVNGHLVGDPCSTSCRTCGFTYCDDCEGHEQFTTCVVCWEDVCQSCVTTCSTCGSNICGDHNTDCAECDSVTCHLCGEPCSTCESFTCDSHLTQCPDCGDLHCQDHIHPCDQCDSPRCDDDIAFCATCNDRACSEHRATCTTCGETHCEDHIEACTHCTEQPDSDTEAFCDQHTITCSVGGEVVCSNHRVPKTIGSGEVCQDHRSTCKSCNIGYSDTALSDGHCTACQSIGDVPEAQIPPELTSEFRTIKAGRNEAYMVALGKKLLGRNKVIVYDLTTGEEVNRHSAGMLKQLLGGYK